MAMNRMRLYVNRDGERFPLPMDPTYVDHRVFAAATAESHTVPSGAVFCIIYAPVDTYYNKSTTAAVPAADVTDGSGSTLVPAGYPRIVTVKGVTTLSVIASAAGVVTLEFYNG